MKLLTTVFLFIAIGVAQAQSPCDDLTIEPVQYSPFTDTIVYVSVLNSGPEIFSYPNFMLINSDGDTVANEVVNLFGIGSESLHSLNVYSGVQDPQQSFVGDLELHVGFQDSLACSWSLNQSLCAATPCDSVFIGLQNWGGALVTGDFSWNVKDEDQNTIESGTFTMIAEEQTWFLGLCLEPGRYTYSLTFTTQASGGGPNLTVSSTLSFPSPTLSTPLDWFNDPGAELEFSFFEFCLSSPNSISESVSENKVSVFRNGTEVLLQSKEIIENVVIYSMDGKLVYSNSPNTTNLVFPTELPAGVYLVQLEVANKLEVIKISI